MVDGVKNETNALELVFKQTLTGKFHFKGNATGMLCKSSVASQSANNLLFAEKDRISSHEVALWLIHSKSPFRVRPSKW